MVRIDQLETLHPSPHSRTILGETRRGAAASTGKKWGHSQTRGSHRKVLLSYNGGIPHSWLGTRKDGASFQRKEV